MILNLKDRQSMVKAGYTIIILILFAGLISCGKISETEITNINSFKIKGFEGNALAVEADLSIKNPSGHRIHIKDIDAKIYIDKNYLGRINSIDPVSIKPRSSDIYAFVLYIRMANPLGAALTVMNLKQGQRINIKIEGEITARTSLIKRKIDIKEERSVVL